MTAGPDVLLLVSAGGGKEQNQEQVTHRHRGRDDRRHDQRLLTAEQRKAREEGLKAGSSRSPDQIGVISSIVSAKSDVRWILAGKRRAADDAGG